MDSIWSCFPHTWYILTYYSQLCYSIIFQLALSLFLPSSAALSTMAGNFVFGVFLTSYWHSNSRLYQFHVSGYIPSSAISTVLLVVLEHPSTLLAAAMCTVSGCRTNFAFPSRTFLHVLDVFDTITFIRILILYLVIRLWSSSCRFKSSQLPCF